MFEKSKAEVLRARALAVTIIGHDEARRPIMDLPNPEHGAKSLPAFASYLQREVIALHADILNGDVASVDRRFAKLRGISFYGLLACQTIYREELDRKAAAKMQSKPKSQLSTLTLEDLDL